MSSLFKWLLLGAVALPVVGQAQYGLNSRPAFTAYNNGIMPPNAPTFTGTWSAVPAFPNVTFVNSMGTCELPGQASNARRMVVWEREGRVYSFPKSSSATNADKLLMLDISTKCQGWDDSGLMNVAFHPNFGSGPSNNRYVFLYYTWVTPGTVQGSSTIRPPTYKSCRDRLARFTVNLDGTIDPASETILIDQFSGSVWHNGGGMFFHPDNGFLYLTNGDDADSGTNGQIINRGLYSGVLRIDVDQRGGSISHPIPRQPLPAGSLTQNYFIPNDNPFVGQSNVMEELFCIGLRSPHRMTIDPVSKRIFIGDVGLSTWEEVDVIEPNQSGENFQWPRIEGLHGNLTAPYIGNDHPPIINYSHVEGSAVIGGYVYRGTQFASDLGGKYIFGDNGSGTIYYLNEQNDPATKVALCTLPNGAGPASGSNYTGLSSFGVDADGELYLCQMSSLGGKIYTLQRGGAPPPALPTTLSATGLLSNLANITPATGFVGYDVNNPLWSDRAHKYRWMAIPSAQTIGFNATGEWSFPEGSIWLKHFDLPIDDNNPNIVHRLETRVLVRDNAGYVYGMTYKWRADNSDADLVQTGLNEDIPITGNVNLGTLSSTDIGGAATGTTVAFNGGYAVTGGGADIYGTSDAFRFVASQKTGDFDIATRIESVDRADLYTKAGLMVRESLAANARNVMALVFPSNEARNNNTGGYEFQSRDTLGGASTTIYPTSPQPAVRYPNAWLRLARVGNVFTAYYSRNGTDWSQFASKSLSLPSTVYFGMAVTSHNASALATARFNFNIDRVQTWYFPGREDCLQCHRTVTGGVIGVSTRQSNRDHFFTETNTTDNQLRAWNHAGYFTSPITEANIPSMSKMVALTDNAATAEQKMRSYFDSNCQHCHRPGGVPAFWDARFETPLNQQGIVNGLVSSNLGIANAKVIAPQSVDRSVLYQRMCTATGSYKMPPLAKGLVDQTAMGVLDQWIAEVTQPPADPLPPPWAHADIGSVGFAGDATYLTSAGTFIVQASGDDIENNADAFHYTYQPLSGDGEIIARVQSLTPTDPYTKAGLMIRDSLAANSANAMITLMSAHGAQLQYRSTTGGGSSYVLGQNVVAPYYLRLRRQGSVITAYIAVTNGAWQQIGTTTLALGATPYIGMAVTAHNNAQTATALFDNVSVITGGLPMELKINFQPAAAQVPDGYLVDGGAVFGARGNGFSYGWDADVSGDARDRNAASSPDQRYDTLIHFQRVNTNPSRVWEVTLPNGMYAVHVVAGDPNIYDSHHVIAAEGTTILDGTPSASAPFIEATQNVAVNDGMLTLSQGAGGTNTKINYVDIQAVNGAVTVALTTPVHQASFFGAAANAIDFTASASTSNGGATITKVEYYQGITKIGEALTAPFAFTWSAPPTGAYRVLARALDSTGASGLSAFADITVSQDGAFGLEGEYWPNLTMSGAPLTRSDANIQFDWSTGVPMNGIPNDNFSVRWRGRIKPQFTETYTFTSETDDGVRLWVNGQLLIDKWVNQGTTQWTGTITLTAGQLYDIEMHYFDNFGAAVAKLYWSSTSQPQQAVPASALFNTLPGTNHRPRAPDILIPATDGELTDPISIVMQTGAFQDVDATNTHAASDWQIWTTTASPLLVWNALNKTGAALTYATLNEGVFVNGFAQLDFNTGYQLRVRHKDNSGTANSEWSAYALRSFTTTGPDLPHGITAEYFNNTRLSGAPVVSRTENNINYTYGNGAPPSTTGVNADNFSVRWRARVKPQFSETYTFTTETDDGARLWVNGVQLVDKWIGQGATPWSGQITLVAGQYYDLEMQYFDGAFGASAKLYWSSPSQAQQIIPTLRLYAIDPNANHRPLVPNVTLPAADDSFVDATSGTMSTGAFEDQDAGHTHVATDWEIWDNSGTPTRIWNALNQTGMKRTTVAITDGLFEGTHEGRTSLIGEQAYKLRVRHKDSSADANSEWSAWSDWRYFVGSDAPLAHGLAAEFYPQVAGVLTGPLQRIDERVDFNWGQGEPMAGVGVDSFVARWRGRVKPEFSETYTFKTESDDGARLYVNGQLIIDKFQFQGTTAWTGTIALQAGQLYDIELHYLEGGFDANVKLSWSSVSRTEQVIPGNRLYLPAVGANHRPWNPGFFLVGTNLSALNFGVSMIAPIFTDLDVGQTHAASDWEMWTTTGTIERVWSALNQTGATKTTITARDGVFEGSLAAQGRLNFNTTYLFRARVRDSSGSAVDEWGPWSTATTTTVSQQQPLWLINNFTIAERADPLISGDDADPDHDGLPNLVEFALGSSPKVNNAAPVTITGKTGSTLEMDFPFAGQPEVMVTVETSTSLTGTWTSTGLIYTHPQSGTIHASVPFVPGEPRRFVRLRVTKP